MGTLIIIEAGDGSGKATQTEMLKKHLEADGRRVLKISFPDYESRAAEPLKMYLEGAYGKNAADVNAYAASTFFAVDRFASYKLNWKKAYDAGVIILADRYTTSNMVHQAVKLIDTREREDFLKWLWDFEFGKLGLPIPDVVVFLDMEPAVSDRLIAERYAKDQKHKQDIHETDKEYLHRCHATYVDLAEKYGWKKVKCSENGVPRTIEAIHADVYRVIKDEIDDKGSIGG